MRILGSSAGEVTKMNRNSTGKQDRGNGWNKPRLASMKCKWGNWRQDREHGNQTEKTAKMVGGGERSTTSVTVQTEAVMLCFVVLSCSVGSSIFLEPIVFCGKGGHLKQVGDQQTNEGRVSFANRCPNKKDGAWIQEAGRHARTFRMPNCRSGTHTQK